MMYRRSTILLLVMALFGAVYANAAETPSGCQGMQKDDKGKCGMMAHKDSATTATAMSCGMKMGADSRMAAGKGCDMKSHSKMTSGSAGMSCCGMKDAKDSGKTAKTDKKMGGMKMDDAKPAKADSKKSPSGDVIYTCPMHAEVVQSKPGKCPKCGMNLEPKEK